MIKSAFIVAVAGALGSMAALTGGPANDTCPSATAIDGAGMFAFDNDGAVTDGLAHDSCGFTNGNDIAHDVWYCWTSPCDVNVSIDTCGGTTVDTRVAVYDGCDCPASDTNLLGCDDDACVYQSRAEFSAVSGQSYLLRVGTHPELGGGAGTFTMTCGSTLELACDEDDGLFASCRVRSFEDGQNSTRGQYVVADDFSVLENSILTQVRWWGTYFDGTGYCQISGGDAFEIRYYMDQCGQPGALIGGPFVQAEGTVNVTGRARTCEKIQGMLAEYVYTAAHPPVEILAGQAFWIEITNIVDEACSWYWSAATSPQVSPFALQDGLGADGLNGFDVRDAVASDMAFCLDALPGSVVACANAPENDDCQFSQAVVEGETWFSTRGATTDGFVESACGFLLGDQQVNNDTWFSYQAPCAGLLAVETCDTEFDTKIAIYAGSDCPTVSPALSCNDDSCGNELALGTRVLVPVSEGEGYMIRVGAFGNTTGSGTLLLTYEARPPEGVNLLDFANASTCFTGACLEVPCDPPLYHSMCCQSRDYDFDGDVDLDDLTTMLAALSGP